jgi:hypothetical protein
MQLSAWEFLLKKYILSENKSEFRCLCGESLFLATFWWLNNTEHCISFRRAGKIEIVQQRSSSCQKDCFSKVMKKLLEWQVKFQPRLRVEAGSVTQWLWSCVMHKSNLVTDSATLICLWFSPSPRKEPQHHHERCRQLHILHIIGISLSRDICL